jgi:Tol biopolymer transport system component
MQADGRLQTPLTDDPASDVEPDWAADGRTVVFSSDREGQYDLHLMNDVGADQRALAITTTDDRQSHWFVQPPLSSDELAVALGISAPPYNLSVISTSGAHKTEILKSDESDDTMPDWSSDGRKIVFASNLSGNYDLYVLEVEGNEFPEQLTSHEGADMHPAWSPVGGKIVFESKRDEGDWDIWLINVDGSELRNLTADLNSNEGNPAWSPDGKQIVFSSDRDGDFDIFVMNADDSGETWKLTDLPGDEYHPVWSPDEDEIVFRATNSVSGQRQLFIMKSDGQALVPLFKSQANDDSPSWSPDSRWVVFVSDRANPGNRNQPGKFDVYIYDTLTGDIFQVTQGENDVRYPAWRPTSTNVNP